MVTPLFTDRDLDYFASSLNNDRDPFIEDYVIPNIPRPRKRRPSKGRNSRKKTYQDQRNRRFSFRANIQQRFSRGSNIIIRFLREDGYAEFRLQRDRNNDNNFGFGNPLKSKPGFVFGSPLDDNETDETAALRETMEEALIPENMGQLVKVDTLNIVSRYRDTSGFIKANYAFNGFVYTVPFNTPDGKGDQVYEHDRCTREEIDQMISKGLILPNHATIWLTARAMGLI